jgi:hypothetical protein
MHTVKNLLLIDARLRIIFLSETSPGKTHGKTLADKLKSGKNLRLKSDLGFEGLVHSKLKIATLYKEPKGKALSENEKIENPGRNAWRVKIGHD